MDNHLVQIGQNQQIYTLPKFAEKHSGMFTLSALHNLIWKAKPHTTSQGVIPGNGLEKAVIRVGRRVLLDEKKFFQWLEDQQIAE